MNTFSDGSTTWVITEDLDGNPRPQDGDGDCLAIADVGCYEAATILCQGAATPPLARLLAGDGSAQSCVKYHHEVLLRVDGSVIPLNKFTGAALANVILGFMKTLKGSEAPHRVEIEFEVREDA